MSDQEALDALKDALKTGDFQKALPLLEEAARENGFASSVINHAYTLVLFHTGNKARLAEVAFQIGRSRIESNPASALDYFQRAMIGGLDAAHVRQIGETLETWAASRVHSDNEPAAGKSTGPITRVAHVVGSLQPGMAPARYLKMLTASLAEQGIESSIFTTEWDASWFYNPEGVVQSQDSGISVKTIIASLDGDFVERAARVAAAIRESNVQAIFYHVGPFELITARVAAERPAPTQIHVNHLHDGSELDAAFFDGYIQLFRNALERSHHKDRPAEWIPLASDIEARMRVQPPATRVSLGLGEAKSVSATFGNLQNAAGEGYLAALLEILKRFPDHFHLFAGAGDVKSIRGQLHSADVLSRVRFLGHMADVAPLLNVVDVYFASFPHSGGLAILEAMGAGKPVVALAYPPDSTYNSGAELVGIPELIARNRAGYIEIADRLIRNSAIRSKLASAAADRFRSEFRPSMMASRYMQFLSKF